MADTKTRLDNALVARGVVPTRAKAQGMILAGDVQVNGTRVDKAGTRVTPTDEITLRQKPRFVGRGGEKLVAALEHFPVDVSGRVCADVGACTGGFTDCLLQSGAGRVYAIDVGYGQLDYTLRQHPRVVVLERTNARYLEALDEPVSLVVADVSFISLRLLMPVMVGWLNPPADFVLLIKPQFEAGRDDVGKGGIVRDPKVHARVLREVLNAAVANGMAPRGLMESPIKGSEGNTEFLAWLTVGLPDSDSDQTSGPDRASIAELIAPLFPAR